MKTNKLKSLFAAVILSMVASVNTFAQDSIEIGALTAPFSNQYIFTVSPSSDLYVTYYFTLTATTDITISNSGSTVSQSLILFDAEDYAMLQEHPDENFEHGYIPGTRLYEYKVKNLPPGNYSILMDWGGYGQVGKSLITTIQGTPCSAY